MRSRFVVAALAIMLVVSGWMAAQTTTTGQIIGTVKDSTGAVIAGAKVTLVSAAGERRELTTDAEGAYRFPLLAPGAYQISISAPNFAAFKSEGVIVKVTQTTELEASLSPQGASEKVEVTAEGALVQSTTPTTGRVIGDTQIKQLPLPTRNFQQLLTLSPGTTANLSNNTELGRGDATIDVNGQRGTSNNVIVDGTPVNSIGTNSTPNLSVPAPDAIQEFIVQTSMYDATAGRNAGGNVAVVTKSGSNKFHGSAYEFLRNDALNANDFFLNRAGHDRPVLKRNQFGGTLGGPIVKDKTFFFVSYQGTRERNGASLTNSLTTPNIPAGLTNDRSTAALQALATSFGVPLNPVSQALLQAKLPSGQFAIPSAGPNPGGLAFVPTPLTGVSRFTEDQFNVNVDQNVTANNRLSGKFFFSNAPQFQSQFSFVGSNAFQVPGYGGNIDFHNRVVTLSDTHVFNPHLINEARFGLTRIWGLSTPEEPFTNAQFGITNPLADRFPGLATISVTGLFSIGSTTLADQKSVTESLSWSDMLSYTHGRHAVKFGGDVFRHHADFYFNFFSRGDMIFASFPAFLSGILPGSAANPSLALLGNGVHDRGMRATDFDWYAQDDFKVNDKLTVNIGARVERFGGISEIKGRLVNFDPQQFAQNTLPCTILAPCTGNNGFHILSPGETLNPNDWGVAPRFGFAYKPATSKSLVMRGGFGVYFDRFSTRVANLQIFNYPFDIVGVGLGTIANTFPNLANVTFPVADARIPSPVPFFFSGIPLPTLPTPISGIYVDKNFRTPYVYHYNFGFQYEPFKNWLVEVGYVGSKGTKLINTITLNQGTSPTTAPFTSSGFSNNKVLNGFQMAQTSGISHYDSLQASLTKRMSKYLQFLASYTWSKSVDDASGSPTNEFAALPGDQQNFTTQRAVSDFDRPHRFVFSGLFDVPKLYHGDMAFMKKIVNDWELASVMTFQSGTPFSVVCTAGSALFNRADLVGGQTITVSGGTKDKLGNYFNTAAFGCSGNVAPFGTSGRNLLRGPGQKNTDLSIVKFIPITERQKMEFRSEFFNVFNWVNFANPANNKLVSTAGQITSTATGPRVIQFALKYNF